MTLTIKPIGSNMTELHFSGGVVLFSYQTPVALKVLNHKTKALDFIYKTDKKWSNTTTKHINKWFGTWFPEAKPQSFFDDLVSEFDLKDI